MKKFLKMLIVVMVFCSSIGVYADQTTTIRTNELRHKFDNYFKANKINLTTEEKDFIKKSTQKTKERVQHNMEQLEIQLDNLKPNFTKIKLKYNDTDDMKSMSFETDPKTSIILGGSNTTFYGVDSTDENVNTSTAASGDISFTNLNTSNNKMHALLSAIGNGKLGGNYSAWGQIGKAFEVVGSGSAYADIAVKSNVKGKLEASGDGYVSYKVRARIYDLTNESWVKTSDDGISYDWSYDLFNLEHRFDFNRSTTPEILNAKLRGGHIYVVVTEMLTSGDSGIIGSCMTHHNGKLISGFGLNSDKITIEWR